MFRHAMIPQTVLTLVVLFGCGTGTAQVPTPTPAAAPEVAPPTTATAAPEVAAEVTTVQIEVTPAAEAPAPAVPASHVTARTVNKEDKALRAYVEAAQLDDISRVTGIGTGLLKSAITDAAAAFHPGHTFDTSSPGPGKSAELRRFVTVASPVMDSRREISISQGMRMDSHATTGLEFGHRIDFLSHSPEPFADALNWSADRNTPEFKRAILKSLRKTIARYRTR